MAQNHRHRPSASSLSTGHGVGANAGVAPPLKSARRPTKTPVKTPHPLANKFPLPNALQTPSKPAEEDLSRLEPDQMFARFLVPEVRALQTRLRTEADSKQEELRLMVGERYRDLLQASTAIVSISETAKNVKSTLEDMKDACNTSKDVRALHGHRGAQNIMSLPGMRGKQTAVPDLQLVTLQSLAAHLKLLLDTPEQLWRLLERKRFLQAAWLYLLARVVYRALTYDEDESEEHDIEWAKEGIQVVHQFPLIQRQWDTISSFRSQISYRASQSLREVPISPTPSPSPYLSAAETLVSILLLDSLPLSDTLALFLSQRTKTLQTVFTGHSQSNNASGQSSAISKSRRKNQELAASLLRSPNPTPSRAASPVLGSTSDFRLPSTGPPAPSTEVLEKRTAKRKRDKILKHVQQSLKRSVDIVSATLGAVRSMYSGGKEQPLIEGLLQNAVSSGSPEASAVNAVNTLALLKTLPSSTLLVRYLPASIQSYAPFIDTTSPSSRLSQHSIESASSKWCETSLKSVETHLASWLDDLDGVSEVWSIWTGLQHSPDGWREILTAEERERLLNVVQAACVKRVKEVWNENLAEIEAVTVREVQRCVKILREGGKESEPDIQPSAFYFAPEYLASVSGGDLPAGLLSASSTLTKCKEALQQRVASRTPLLHSVLTQLESLAKDLHDDLAVLQGPNGENAAVAGKLMKLYLPEAQSSALNMAKSLQALLRKQDEKSDLDQSTRIAVFIGKVALELAVDSPFVVHAIPGLDDYAAFRAEMSAVHDASLDGWRVQAVVVAMEDCRHIFDRRTVPESTSATPMPSTPSSHLSKSLLTLASSVQELGFARRSLLEKQISKQLLDSFAAAVASEVPSDVTVTEGPQVLWDMVFISRLCADRNTPTQRETPALAPSIKRVRALVGATMSPKNARDFAIHVDSTVDLHLSRTGLLLGLLLPSPLNPTSGLTPLSAAIPQRARSGTLLAHTPPPAEKDFQLAMEIAKPSSRFGMLMIGSVDGRNVS